MASNELLAMSSGPALSPLGKPVMPGDSPFSGSSALAESSPQSEVVEEDANAELGDLAMAFKEATDPADAADLLLEFLSVAGFER